MSSELTHNGYLEKSMVKGVDYEVYDLATGAIYQ